MIQLAQIALVALENASLYDQLRDQDRRKDEFLAVLAHELRNPLAPIRTGLHVLRMTDDKDKLARTQDMMERQLVHLVRMVDDLLDISRITRGKVALKKERLAVHAVVSSAVDTVRPWLDAGDQQLTVRLPSSPLFIDADPTRIAQVIANLVNNAAKYSPRGSQMVLDATGDGNTLTLRLTDNGAGIPPNMLPRIFDMFTQLHGEQTGGGLGIGLALARRLVELHHGTITAESAGLGKGSTFTVRLPLARAVNERSTAPSLPDLGEGLRILVVDDNVDAAESLATLLELSGHETRLAHTGQTALPAASEFRPHVVLLDIGLPELDATKSPAACAQTRP